jgi:hypothetical protein
MSVPIKPLVLAIVGLASPGVEAQLLRWVSSPTFR